jgi:hypothetical protein
MGEEMTSLVPIIGMKVWKWKMMRVFDPDLSGSRFENGKEVDSSTGSVQKSVSQNVKQLTVRSTANSKHGTQNCPGSPFAKALALTANLVSLPCRL